MITTMGMIRTCHAVFITAVQQHFSFQINESLLPFVMMMMMMMTMMANDDHFNDNHLDDDFSSRNYDEEL